MSIEPELAQETPSFSSWAEDFTVTTPVTEEEGSGGLFVTADTLNAMALQHLKTLMYTIPGERSMVPGFGVGIQRVLFEQDTISLRTDIVARIRGQIGTYIPYIIVENINVPPTTDNNVLSVGISFYVSHETSVYGPYLARWIAQTGEGEGDVATDDEESGGYKGNDIFDSPNFGRSTNSGLFDMPSPLAKTSVSSSPVFSGLPAQALAGPIATFLVTK